jgi:O-antigen/teichoic acid export membrane protein
VISLLSFPASVGIVVVAPVFVRAVLGPDWLGMIVPIQLLGAYAVVRSIRSPTVPLFRAIDRPDYDTKIRLLKLLLIGSFIYPASQLFGVAGVALVILGHTLVVAPIASYVAVRSVEGRMVAFGRALFYPAVGSTVMGAVVYGLRERIVGVPLAAELLLLVLAGGLVYVGVVLVLERQFGVGLGQLYQVVHDWAQ